MARVIDIGDGLIIVTGSGGGGSVPQPLVGGSGFTDDTFAPALLNTAPPVTVMPTAGQGFALDVAGKIPSTIPLSGAELAYTEYTAGVTISATTEGTANTVVAANDTTFDGTPVRIAFHSPVVQVAANAAGNFVVFVLYEDGASIGKLGDKGTTSNLLFEDDCSIGRRHTPAKGPHTYSIRAFRTNANCTVTGGAGGNGNFMPGYILITRV